MEEKGRRRPAGALLPHQESHAARWQTSKGAALLNCIQVKLQLSFGSCVCEAHRETALAGSFGEAFPNNLSYNAAAWTAAALMAS